MKVIERKHSAMVVKDETTGNISVELLDPGTPLEGVIREVPITPDLSVFSLIELESKKISDNNFVLKNLFTKIHAPGTGPHPLTLEYLVD